MGAGGAVYFNSLGNGFTFDDPMVILNNPNLQTLSFGRLLVSPYPIGDLYRPIVMVSYGLNVLTGGFNPLGYHLFNLTLHLIVSVVIQRFVFKMSGNQTLATVTSLLFVLHPIHTEAVSSVVGRAELLATLFGTLSLYTFQLHESEQGPHRWALGALSVLLLGVAALSKESALAVILIFPVYRWIFREEENHLQKVLSFHLFGSLLVLGLTLWLRFLVVGQLTLQGSVQLIGNPLAYVGFLPRLWTSIGVLGDYLSLLFFPVMLSADYSYPQIPIESSPFEWRSFLSGILILLTLTASAYAYWKKNKEVAFGILFFFLGLALTSNILFPIGTIKAERLLYLPSLGFCLVVGVGFTHFLKRSQRLGIVLFAATLVLYGAKTIVRNQDWINNEALFRQTVLVSPRNAKAHFNLGVAYSREGKWVHAEREYRQALELYPEYEEACRAIGQLHERNGILGRAVSWYKQCSSINPTSVEARINLGMSLLRVARTHEAMREFESAVELDPSSSKARAGVALALLQGGKRGKAISVLMEAKRRAPQDPLITNFLKEVQIR
jgi:Flp pilus assembly protein TadD